MKVALITNIPSPYKVGFLYELSKIHYLSIDIYFCAKRRPDRLWNLNLEHIPNKIFLPGSTLIVPFWRKKLYIHVNPLILKYLKNNQYDAIVVGGYDSITTLLAYIYAMLKKIPIIFWCESTLFEKRPKIVKLLKKFFLPKFFKGFSAFMVAGTRSKEYLLYYKVKPSKIFITPLTTDIKFFSTKSELYRKCKERIKQELKLRFDRTILYVGKLIPEKGVVNLLKAYNTLIKKGYKLNLLIIGEGPLQSKILDYIKRHNLNDVHLLGFVQHHELPKYYSVADIFVLPSLSEPWGLVINEAMASGLPIIATEFVGAAGDLIENGKNGYIVPSGDENALAESISNIISDSKLLRAMGNYSYKIIKEWNYEKGVRNFIAAVRKAVRN